MSGLAVGRAVIDYIQAREQSTSARSDLRPTPGSSGISSVSLLLGGGSLAYSPVQGPFAEYLTESGFERSPREGVLSRFRDSLESEFHSRGFEFDRSARASKVKLSADGRFRVETSRAEGRSYFEAEKVVLALGHTLRDIPAELRRNVIQGAGELCVKLTEELPHSSSREECLARLLSRYPRTAEGIVRIGLAGVGASMIEVVKIIESLLDKPSDPSDKYRTRGHGTPVELVIFDAEVGREGSLFDGLCSRLRRFLSSSEVTTFQSPLSVAQEIEKFKRNAETRLVRFNSSRQLQVVPSRVDWTRLMLQEGFIVPSTDISELSAPLSVLIDCAPFEQGIDGEQRAVIEELPILNFQQLKPSLWSASRVEQQCKGRLALAGAAFRPKTEWAALRMYTQACQIIDEFYGQPPVP